MKAKDIYALSRKHHIKGDTDIYTLSSLLENMYDLSFGQFDEEKNKKILIRSVHYQDYHDAGRGWELSAVFFEEKPFAILQEAGRSLSDHQELLITNKDLLKDVIGYIKEISSPEKEALESHAFYTEDDDVSNFYGHDLSDFFDETLEIEHKVGDIVEAFTATQKEFGYIFDTTPLEKRNVKIVEIISKTNPHTTYRAYELNRKYHYPDNSSFKREIVEIKDNDATFLNANERIYIVLNKDLKHIH